MYERLLDMDWKPIEVGGSYRIERSAGTDEDGWENSWTSTMDRYVGKTGIAKAINSRNSGVLIDIGEGANYAFPTFVLRRCNPREVIDLVLLFEDE